jgi:sugar-specific transcriptional regulator TrmB
MSASEATLKALRELGLTQYEMNSYLALVDGGQMSASEVSSKSGVPYSRIFDVLGSLSKRGFIIVKKERPTLYQAKSPRECVKLVQLDWEAKLDRFSKVIVSELQPRFEQETPATTRDVWLLHGTAAILAKALEILEDTKEEILLSLPSFDLNDEQLSSVIDPVLGVKAKVKVLTSTIPKKMRDLIPSHFEVSTRDKVFGAGVVADRTHTLIMLSEGTEETESLGIYSSHHVFADMAAAYFESLWKDSTPL